MNKTADSSELFKVLGVKTRIQIIELLKLKGPMGAKNISGVLGITVAAVSQHLKTLRQAGLVTNERQGYWIPYSIDEDALEQCRGMLNKVCACGCHGKKRNKENDESIESLESLMKQKEELEHKMECVQKRILEMSKGGE
ncbi:ArsR/SmtB family transcription factor [Candidatus Omnitrophota bacterium]